MRDAAHAIEHAGSPLDFGREIQRDGASLFRLDPVRSIALEIAVNESVERKMLGLHARALEFYWKREEELACIIDEELTPKRVLERHLSRLPITVLPRRRHSGSL